MFLTSLHSTELLTKHFKEIDCPDKVKFVDSFYKQQVAQFEIYEGDNFKEYYYIYISESYVIDSGKRGIDKQTKFTNDIKTIISLFGEIPEPLKERYRVEYDEEN